MGNNRFFNEMFNIFLVLDLFSKKKLQYDRIKKYINLAELKKFLPGRVDESLLHIGGRLGGGLHEDEPVLPGKGLTLLPLHVSPRLQVTERNNIINKSIENNEFVV